MPVTAVRHNRLRSQLRRAFGHDAMQRSAADRKAAAVHPEIEHPPTAQHSQNECRETDEPRPWADECPARSSAARPSGSKPSPQALSMGGCAPSATITRNPRSPRRDRRRQSRRAAPNHENVGRVWQALTHASDLTTGAAATPNRIPDPWPQAHPACPAPAGGSS